VKHLSVIHGFIYLLLGLLSIPCLQEFLKINSISTVLVLHYGKHAVCLITKHPRLNLTWFMDWEGCSCRRLVQLHWQNMKCL